MNRRDGTVKKVIVLRDYAKKKLAECTIWETHVLSNWDLRLRCNWNQEFTPTRTFSHLHNSANLLTKESFEPILLPIASFSSSWLHEKYFSHS